VSRRLAFVDAPWCVVGGWALDLWRGRQTRPHHDIEIAVPRNSFAVLRAALETDCILYAAGGGTLRRLAATDPFPRAKHQCWVREGDAWRLDVMQEPGDAERWVFRRDERLGAPRARLLRRTAGGIPYLAPEAVLLFKAKGVRDKDEADLTAAAPHLDSEARAWLTNALTLTAPGHPWIARLTG
jgi:aminoglycoside-2''-adenylyltransferase